jgi:uncharacterized membrane protein
MKRQGIWPKNGLKELYRSIKIYAKFLSIQCIMNKFIIAAIILFILDTIWLSLVGGNLFSNMVGLIQQKPMKINFLGAIVAYILLILGVYWFAIKDYHKATFDTFIRGFILGLVIYGVFDGTNLAIFRDYDLKVGIIDTLWGSILCGVTAYGTLYINKY